MFPAFELDDKKWKMWNWENRENVLYVIYKENVLYVIYKDVGINPNFNPRWPGGWGQASPPKENPRWNFFEGPEGPRSSLRISQIMLGNFF